MSRPNKCPRLNELNGGNPELPTLVETPPITRVVRVGSRKSKLALIQTHQVLNLLRQAYRECDTSRVRFEFELVTMTTKGDQILDIPLAQIGSKALFTKELEQALLDEEIDLIVHSCKDLPTTLPPGLRIAAILRYLMNLPPNLYPTIL
jgi:hydroxymethylbilane synthase